ncbi:CBASS cGAMP-activated phospholipase [Rhodobacter capsulatus]|uniref:Patatin-like phospholipase n=1 Tax=Rhodobacter capsulatus TaxID=1061 RepID=A0A1G7R516_RHOCA|nr:CBASS cGAMP-activated phospholipase [Rhodobacter capsulatus]WER08385.1 CBASS cGAMP-activated phospholipase [Rhodobacter capsulatus]SDG05060.1 Patatin-like phospholipase [Rhodobacter capsulatus]
MPRDNDYDHTVPRRSDGTKQTQRVAQPWPTNKPFRILSIDGGGILGLLPTLVLAEIEKRYLGGEPIGQHFDLIAGTSTGGIIALGLGQGMSAQEISKIYIERGDMIFPQGSRLTRWLRRLRQLAMYGYNRTALENELRRIFQTNLLGSSKVPLCIPAFEGRYGEPYIFKTPHHPDYKRDQYEKLVDVGVSTAAAPTFFSAIKRDGYTFIDGGVWANNPVMVALVEALSCFEIERRQVRIVSLGTGQTRFRASRRLQFGGRLLWASGFYAAAMRSQSHNALGQAYLLVGKDQVLRLDAPETATWIEMDDVRRAIDELPSIARSLVESAGHHVVKDFLGVGSEMVRRVS